MVDDHGMMHIDLVAYKEVKMTQKDVITISQFKATCLGVLDNVKRTGQSILVTRHGKPIAMVGPPPPPEKTKSWLGSFKSKGKICGDIVSPVVQENEWSVLNE